MDNMSRYDQPCPVCRAALRPVCSLLCSCHMWWLNSSAALMHCALSRLSSSFLETGEDLAPFNLQSITKRFRPAWKKQQQKKKYYAIIQAPRISCGNRLLMRPKCDVFEKNVVPTEMCGLLLIMHWLMRLHNGVFMEGLFRNYNGWIFCSYTFVSYTVFKKLIGFRFVTELWCWNHGAVRGAEATRRWY